MQELESLFGRRSAFPVRPTRVVVRSPHAHARIRGIDARAARAAPGVLAVLTGADLAADGARQPARPTASRKRRDGSPAFQTPRPALVQRARPPRRRSARARGGRDGGSRPSTRAALVCGRLRAAARGRRRGGRASAGRARGVGRGARQRRLRVEAGIAKRGGAGLRRRPPTSRASTSWSRAWPPPRSSRAPRWASTTGAAGATRFTRASRRRTACAPCSPSSPPACPQSHVRVITGEVGGSFGMRSGDLSRDGRSCCGPPGGSAGR